MPTSPSDSAPGRLTQELLLFPADLADDVSEGSQDNVEVSYIFVVGWRSLMEHTCVPALLRCTCMQEMGRSVGKPKGSMRALWGETRQTSGCLWICLRIHWSHFDNLSKQSLTICWVLCKSSSSM